MKVNVSQQRPAQACRERQHTRRKVERYAVDVSAQKGGKPDIDFGHQCQRRQEVLAELSISDPRPPFEIALERKRVNEQRTAAVELNVVRTGVLERHPVLEGEQLDP